MSHFSRLKTAFKNREILIRCLQEMGYEVHEGGTVRGHRGERAVDLSVQMEKGYGVGFSLNSEGTYDIVADWWGVKGTHQDRLLQKLQVRVHQIQQEYALKTVLEQTEKEGYTVIEKHQEKDGQIRLILRRWE